MDRFHIVVYNYEQIELFLSNFDKIKNFDRAQDRIIILDCSENFENERQKITEFAQARRLKVGEHIKIYRRENWGIDQAARLKYFELLLKQELQCRYTWQFQEHYLDTESGYARWPSGKKNIYGDDISGKLKTDTIPPGTTIDLDFCERIYTLNTHIDVIFAVNEGLGLYTSQAHNFFVIHGANFSFRSSKVPLSTNRKQLQIYKYMYNGYYDLALFMECEFWRMFTARGACYDLKNSKTDTSAQSNTGTSPDKKYYTANDLFENYYEKKRTEFLRLNEKCEAAIKLRLCKKWFSDSNSKQAS